MPNYQKIYITLFNAMTDAIESLRRGCCQAAVDTLIREQQAAEELYISAEDDEDADKL